MNKERKKGIGIGICIMLSASALTCTGQLLWKLAGLRQSLLFVLIGFFLYGCGALLMILALRFGDLSVLHPMLSAGYILSIFLGYFVLGEVIALSKVAGILVIILGLILLSAPEERERA